MTAAVLIGTCLCMLVVVVWTLVMTERRSREAHAESAKYHARLAAEGDVRLATAAQDIPWLHGVRTWEEARERAHAEMARVDQKRGKA